MWFRIKVRSPLITQDTDQKMHKTCTLVWRRRAYFLITFPDTCRLKKGGNTRGNRQISVFLRSLLDGKRNGDRRDEETGHRAEKSGILKISERREERRARGDTERCSPFAARGEATHVARRSFVIRQIAFLPGRVTPEEFKYVCRQRGPHARTYIRVSQASRLVAEGFALVRLLLS